MRNAWLCRYAVLVALCAVYVIISGAVLTNLTHGAAGTAPDPAVTPPAIFSASNHRIAAEAATILALALAIWTAAVEKRTWVRWLGFAALALLVVEAFLGAGPQPIPGGAAWLHALLGPVALSLVCALATLTSSICAGVPNWILDQGWPPLRGLAHVTIFLMILQVALGAAFRHDLASVLWHIGGALLVVLLTLGLAMCVMQAPNCGVLRPFAIALISLAGFQTMLGLTVISMGATGKHQLFTVISSVIHTVTGALTLAAAFVLTALVRRNVVKEKAAA